MRDDATQTPSVTAENREAVIIDFHKWRHFFWFLVRRPFVKEIDDRLRVRQATILHMFLRDTCDLSFLIGIFVFVAAPHLPTVAAIFGGSLALRAIAYLTLWRYNEERP